MASGLWASGTWLTNAETSGDFRQKPILSGRKVGQSTSIVISDALRANLQLGKWECLDQESLQ